MEKVLFRYEGDRSFRKEYFEVASKLRRERTAGAQWRAKLARLPHSFLMTSNVLCVNLKIVPLLGRLQIVPCSFLSSLMHEEVLNTCSCRICVSKWI